MTNAESAPYDILATECAAHEGATDADIKSVLAMELPTTKGGKCLNACIGETTGIVSTSSSSPHMITIQVMSMQQLF